jgi:hypothetical protein
MIGMCVVQNDDGGGGRGEGGMEGGGPLGCQFDPASLNTRFVPCGKQNGKDATPPRETIVRFESRIDACAATTGMYARGSKDGVQLGRFRSDHRAAQAGMPCRFRERRASEGKGGLKEGKASTQ